MLHQNRHKAILTKYIQQISVYLRKMSSVIAVARGTGNLGRSIVETLVSSGKYQVLVFGHEVRP